MVRKQRKNLVPTRVPSVTAATPIGPAAQTVHPACVSACAGVAPRVCLQGGDAAEYAGVRRDTIYTACERREIRHVRIGGRRSIRLKREWIDDWY